MKAIAVLADEVLEQTTVLQGDEGHVCRGRQGRQGHTGFTLWLATLGQTGPGTLRATEIGDAWGRASCENRTRTVNHWD